MNTVELIQEINLGLQLVILGLCLAAWAKRPIVRLRVVPPASWALHGAIYYSVLIGGWVTNHTFWSMWAAALGLHMALLVLGLVWLFLWPAKGWKR